MSWATFRILYDVREKYPNPFNTRLWPHPLLAMQWHRVKGKMSSLTPNPSLPETGWRSGLAPCLGTMGELALRV